MLSTPLDWLLLLLVPWVLRNKEISTLLVSGSALCALLAGAVWLSRDSLIDLLFALHLTQRRLAMRSAWPAIGLVAVVVLGTLADVALRFSKVNTVTVVVGGIVAFGAVASILREVKARRAQATALSFDRTARIEQANYSLFLVGVVPIVGSRLAGLLASAGLLLAQAPLWQAILPPLGVTAFLTMLYPRLEDFTFNCQRCGSTTSRALRAGGLCPMCILDTIDHRHHVVPGSESSTQSLLRRLEAKDDSAPFPHQTSQESPIRILIRKLATLMKGN